MSLTSCGDDMRAPFEGDCLHCTRPEAPQRLADLSCDDSLESPEGPLVGQLALFASEEFDPTDTLPLPDDAELMVLGENGRALACTRFEAPEDFVLHGGAPGPGGLRIDPEEEPSFVSTLIHQTERSNAVLPTVPVFSREQIDSIFDDINVAPRDDGAHIVLLFSEAGIGRRERVPNVTVTTEAAAGVAYRVGNRWRKSADTTDENGLAFLYNVEAQPGLGEPVAITYQVEAGSPVDLELTAAAGAVTFAVRGP